MRKFYSASKEEDWTTGHWSKFSLLDGGISKQFKSKVRIFSDSVLFLGGKGVGHPVVAQGQETDRTGYFIETLEYNEVHDIAGEPVEFALRNICGANNCPDP